MICVQQQDTQLTSSKAFCEKLEDLGCGSSVKPKPEKKILTRRKSQWRMLSNGVEGEDCEKKFNQGSKGNHKSKESCGKKKHKEYSLLDDDDSNGHDTPKSVSSLLFQLFIFFLQLVCSFSMSSNFLNFFVLQGVVLGRISITELKAPP